MTLSSREITLGWVTGLAVLVAATLHFGQPVLDAWSKAVKDTAAVADQIDEEQRTVDLGPRWQERLQTALAGLPRHAVGVDVTAALLREIETQAAQAGLALAERRAGTEEVQAEYSSLEISCRGSASLEAVVTFLYHLRSPTALMEVTQLRIESDKTDYRVRLTVNCVYGRNP